MRHILKRSLVLLLVLSMLMGMIPATIAHKATNKITEEAEKTPETPEIVGLAQIGIEDFAKVQLKTAKVLSGEPVEGADKLLEYFKRRAFRQDRHVEHARLSQKLFRVVRLIHKHRYPLGIVRDHRYRVHNTSVLLFSVRRCQYK